MGLVVTLLEPVELFIPMEIAEPLGLSSIAQLSDLPLEPCVSHSFDFVPAMTIVPNEEEALRDMIERELVLLVD